MGIYDLGPLKERLGSGPPQPRSARQLSAEAAIVASPCRK